MHDFTRLALIVFVVAGAELSVVSAQPRVAATQPAAQVSHQGSPKTALPPAYELFDRPLPEATAVATGYIPIKGDYQGWFVSCDGKVVHKLKMPPDRVTGTRSPCPPESVPWWSTFFSWFQRTSPIGPPFVPWDAHQVLQLDTKTLQDQTRLLQMIKKAQTGTKDLQIR